VDGGGELSKRRDDTRRTRSSQKKKNYYERWARRVDCVQQQVNVGVWASELCVCVCVGVGVGGWYGAAYAAWVLASSSFLRLMNPSIASRASRAISFDAFASFAFSLLDLRVRRNKCGRVSRGEWRRPLDTVDARVCIGWCSVSGVCLKLAKFKTLVLMRM
jgi:hypothetical protein